MRMMIKKEGNKNNNNPIKLKRIPNIHIYFHVCLRGNYLTIVEELVNELSKSKLLEACEFVKVCVLGPKKDKEILWEYLSFSSSKFIIGYESEDMTLFERPCLGILRKDADIALKKKEPFLCLYLHSKGVTRSGNQAVVHWRQLMTFFLIRLWEYCIRFLCDWNVEAVGTLFLDLPRPHFSGNFWWTTDHYLRLLPSKIGPSYDDPEMWIAKQASFFISLFQHPRPLYFESIPPTLYRNLPLQYVIVRDSLCDWKSSSQSPFPFPLLPSSYDGSFKMYFGNSPLKGKHHNQNDENDENDENYENYENYENDENDENDENYELYHVYTPSRYLFGVWPTLDVNPLWIIDEKSMELIYFTPPSKPFYFAPTFTLSSISSIWSLHPRRNILKYVQKHVETSFKPFCAFSVKYNTSTDKPRDIFNIEKESFSTLLKNEKDVDIQYVTTETTVPMPVGWCISWKENDKRQTVYLSNHQIFFIIR
jgi:hypothetical protein